MTQPSAPQHGRRPDDARAAASFGRLLYQYLFFDWLFADVGRARGPIERHSAWQHNRRMRRHLPTYLKRWAVLAAVALCTGWLCERMPNTVAAAWCYTGSGIILTGMTVISVMWIFLARRESL